MGVREYIGEDYYPNESQPQPRLQLTGVLVWKALLTAPFPLFFGAVFVFLISPAAATAATTPPPSSACYHQNCIMTDVNNILVLIAICIAV